MIDRGLNVNMENPPSLDHDGGILEYCRLEDITIQPWSPFQYGFFEGPFIGNDKFPKLNKELENMAKQYGITVEALSIAWLLRHPAKMQPIIGTTKKERVKAISEAYKINLTREEWYALYRSAGNELP
jgi:predicted oxidoreductase